VKALCSLAAGVALSALAACTTVGPNYKIPERAAVKAPAAQGAFLGANTPAVSQAPLPADWWRLYDDPVLNELVTTALTANTDLRVAAANLARAQATVSEARAARGFNGGAAASVEHAQLSGEQYLLPEQLPVMNLADVGVEASYQLDLFGQLRRATEAAQADAAASQAALDLARITVAAETTGAYLDACSAGEELVVAQQTVHLQEKDRSVVERLVAAGRNSAVDLPRARALLDQARAAIPMFEARQRADLFRLAALTGRPPAQFPAAVASCAASPKLTQPVPVGDGGAALLARRPDVRQAERTLAGATARIGVAVGDLYPSVSLGLSAGSTGALSDIGRPATNRWSFGPLISWNFPTRGARARVREADAAADAALARFDGVVLNALRETETDLSTYARDLDRNAELRAARDEARLAQSQSQQLYRAGRSPFLDALDAQRTLAQAEAELAASEAQVTADQVKLFLALGGGWEQAPRVMQSPASRR
jgi:NodT family efflux transporter outer membrane factor (OMF) lipoprotein